MSDGSSMKYQPRRRIADRDLRILRRLEAGLATVGAGGIIIATAQIFLHLSRLLAK